MSQLFRKFVIIGPGLIGGSVGMGVRAARLAARVVGVGYRQSSLDEALERGAIDEASLNAEEAAEEADFVLLCTRVGLFAEMAARVVPRLTAGAVISDVGSTKEAVTAAIEKVVAGSPVAFVGSHPLAGSEQRGVGAARADLFRGSVCIVTPSAASTPEAEARVEVLWRALGATVCRMSPAQHDAVVAEISHLPHLAAAALVLCISEAAVPYAARGFRDMTRIAGGDPALWRDICATNRKHLIRALDQFGERVRAVRDALAAGDDSVLQQFLEEARSRRERLPGTAV